MNFAFSFFYTPLDLISWVYPAEVFPVEVRALGNAITTFTNWAVNPFFGQFSPLALTAIEFQNFYVFFVLDIFAFLCYWTGSSFQRPKERRSSRWMSYSATSWYPTPCRIPKPPQQLWRRMRSFTLWFMNRSSEDEIRCIDRDEDGFREPLERQVSEDKALVHELRNDHIAFMSTHLEGPL
ncbi:uncharacterized protein EKO05_0005418 [Ascochyta rabiei]|uniref:Substrate-specific transmembrane transporter n=1 Tax=Didymella rabiei TaxID=5454 RepID=A0A163JSP9_DIDRA|nr:uncharacterized protein EKO05_0005418 [Ascochyta rabiei]KZM26568.1 substrate-specific transmembrane transporter [Ascochyta rabiei]UPX14948.1 hypothetical protein EKO05_0005418 [Ascochyta rabiei]